MHYYFYLYFTDAKSVHINQCEKEKILESYQSVINIYAK